MKHKAKAVVMYRLSTHIGPTSLSSLLTLSQFHSFTCLGYPFRYHDELSLLSSQLYPLLALLPSLDIPTFPNLINPLPPHHLNRKSATKTR